MLNALRLARPLQQPSLTSFSLSNSRRAPPSVLRFVQAASGSPGKMDSKKQSEPEPETVDTMSSLGEGYATRSDEEGFGGIYGGKQSLSKDEEEKNVHEVGPDQGSDVKEKEKARNQNKVAR